MKEQRIVPFLNYRYFAYALSLGLFVVFMTVTYVFKDGLVLGVDFVGGQKIIAKLEKGVDEARIRKALAAFDPMVQQIGEPEMNEYIISTKLDVDSAQMAKEKGSIDASDKIKSELDKNFKNVKILSVENVGPSVGSYMRQSMIKLIIVSIILMTIYLAYRFEFRYSVGAMVAVLHDVILSVAFCGVADIQINFSVVAALLTIFGYSVNDTIVIFDRIRETTQIETRSSLVDVVNKAITFTMSRTILTSFLTIMTVFALFILGGEGITDFAEVLLFGMVIGVYSTVYIASPVVLGWEKLMKRVRSWR